MMEMVRCKMKCVSKSEEPDGAAQVAMEVVYGGSEENQKFFKYTPGGQLLFSTINPEAAKQIEQGKEYYIDITPVE
jgi:hypothetical protein